MIIVKHIIVVYKALIVLFVFLLATGCTIEYNLNIDKDKISEKSIILEDSFDTIDLKKEKLEQFILANSDQGGPLDEYQVKKIISDYQYGLELSSDNFSKTYFKGCFKNFSIDLDDDVYVLRGEHFNCLNIWNKEYDVKINIKVDGEIIESNSETVHKNVVSWVVDDEDDSIYLKYRLNNKGKTNLSIYILMGSLIVLILGIGLFLYIKNKKNNEI